MEYKYLSLILIIFMTLTIVGGVYAVDKTDQTFDGFTMTYDNTIVPDGGLTPTNHAEELVTDDGITINIRDDTSTSDGDLDAYNVESKDSYTIGGHSVTGWKYTDPTVSDETYYDYNVDFNGKTIWFSVTVPTGSDWNIQDTSNPVNTMITSLKSE